MNINAITSFIYPKQKVQNKNMFVTKPMGCDTFVKSPVFGANKELKYINDYLAGKAFNINKIKVDDIGMYLPQLKIVEEFKDKAIELIERSSWGFYPTRLLDIVEENNLPLLKLLVEDLNWKHFTRFSLTDMFFVASSIQHDGNEEIKEILSNKNIFNLLRQYPTEDVVSELIEEPEMFASYHYNLPEDQRELFEDYAVDKVLDNMENTYMDSITSIPMTNREREILNDEEGSEWKKGDVNDILNRRLEKIIERNGCETPQELLACVSDRVMSSELLTRQNSLINKIAQIPVTEENKPIILQIIEKLNEFDRIPENEELKKARPIAAKQGNTELLKFLFNMNESLSEFSIDLHKKINDPELIENSDDIDELEEYLSAHPNSDINSKTYNHKSLISTAIQNRRIDILKFLAKRDDVNWHRTLVQLLDWPSEYNLKFQSKVLKFLRNLPEEKFNFKEEIKEYYSLHNNKLNKTILTLLENNENETFTEKFKAIYDREGCFTLDQISDIVNYPNFAKIKDEKYNIVGENIGHMIAETYIDTQDKAQVKKLEDIFKRLYESGYDFKSNDDFGTTPIDKAIETKNQPVIDLLRKYQ